MNRPATLNPLLLLLPLALSLSACELFDALSAANIPVSKITLDKTEKSLILGLETTHLTATISPPDATNMAIRWSSHDPTVAVVDDTGLVTPIGVGTTTIEVTSADGKKSATCLATVVYGVGGKGQAGGTVFYDKGSTLDGWRYMECSTAAMTVASWAERREVGNVSHGSIDGDLVTSQEIGSGPANTDAIIAACSAASAASRCRAVTQGGYSDWFLPSLDELNQLYINLAKDRADSTDPTFYYRSQGTWAEYDYWSSTSTVDAAWGTVAWYQDLSPSRYTNSGGQASHEDFYSAEYVVLPVRRF